MVDDATSNSPTPNRFSVLYSHLQLHWTYSHDNSQRIFSDFHAIWRRRAVELRVMEACWTSFQRDALRLRLQGCQREGEGEGVGVGDEHHTHTHTHTAARQQLQSQSTPTAQQAAMPSPITEAETEIGREEKEKEEKKKHDDDDAGGGGGPPQSCGVCDTVASSESSAVSRLADMRGRQLERWQRQRVRYIALAARDTEKSYEERLATLTPGKARQLEAAQERARVKAEAAHTRVRAEAQTQTQTHTQAQAQTQTQTQTQEQAQAQADVDVSSSKPLRATAAAGADTFEDQVVEAMEAEEDFDE